MVAGALALSGVFAGDGVDDPTADATTDAGPTPSATPSAEPTPEDELPGVTFGTAERPLAPGESFTMLDDWTISLGATDLDTWPDIQPQLQQRWPSKMGSLEPNPGTVYVSVPAKVTYTGDPADQDRIILIVVEFLSADGTVGTINTCGNGGLAVEPFDTIDEEPFEGTACTEIDPAQAAEGMWRVFVSWKQPDGARDFVHVYYGTS